MKLKNTPCDCAEYRRIESACRDLLAERDELRRVIATLEAQLGQRPCQRNRCIQSAQLRAERDETTFRLKMMQDSFDKLEAERDEWKRRAKLMQRTMLHRDYYLGIEIWPGFVRENPEAAEWF